MAKKPETDKHTTPYNQLLREGMTPSQVDQKLGIEPPLPPIVRVKIKPPTKR